MDTHHGNLSSITLPATTIHRTRPVKPSPYGRQYRELQRKLLYMATNINDLERRIAALEAGGNSNPGSSAPMNLTIGADGSISTFPRIIANDIQDVSGPSAGVAGAKVTFGANFTNDGIGKYYGAVSCTAFGTAGSLLFLDLSTDYYLGGYIQLESGFKIAASTGGHEVVPTIFFGPLDHSVIKSGAAQLYVSTRSAASNLDVNDVCSFQLWKTL